MTYDAAEPTPKDIIRGRVGDDSNDPASEYLPDVTYLAILARHDDWRLAGVEISYRVAQKLSRDPISITSDKGANVRFTEKAIDQAVAAGRNFQAEYDAEEDGVFDIAEMIVDQFSYRDALHNERLRGVV